MECILTILRIEYRSRDPPCIWKEGCEFLLGLGSLFNFQDCDCPGLSRDTCVFGSASDQLPDFRYEAKAAHSRLQIADRDRDSASSLHVDSSCQELASGSSSKYSEQ
jgi:hypothetical protein